MIAIKYSKKRKSKRSFKTQKFSRTRTTPILLLFFIYFIVFFYRTNKYTYLIRESEQSKAYKCKRYIASLLYNESD